MENTSIQGVQVIAHSFIGLAENGPSLSSQFNVVAFTSILHNEDGLNNYGNQVTAHNVVTMLNDEDGFANWTTDEFHGSHIFSAKNNGSTFNYNFRFENTTNGTLDGNLVFGQNGGNNNCRVNGGASQGINDGDACAGTAADTVKSNANIDSSFDDFIVVSDDTANGEADRLEAENVITDWINFENSLRFWAQDFVGFPDANDGDWCWAGNCQIVDLTFDGADTLFSNKTENGPDGAANGAYTNGAACPSAVHGNVYSTDQKTVPNEYLLNAFEIIGDINEDYDDWDDGAGTGHAGDEDGLCEDDEACIYTPNYGFYQGSGDPMTNECNFTGGQITGVRMFAYPDP